jgi:hypothetical protein
MGPPPVLMLLSLQFNGLIVKLSGVGAFGALPLSLLLGSWKQVESHVSHDQQETMGGIQSNLWLCVWKWGIYIYVYDYICIYHLWPLYGEEWKSILNLEVAYFQTKPCLSCFTPCIS